MRKYHLAAKLINHIFTTSINTIIILLQPVN